MQLAEQHEALVFDYRAAEEGRTESKSEPLTLNLTESQYVFAASFPISGLRIDRDRSGLRCRSVHSRFECIAFRVHHRISGNGYRAKREYSYTRITMISQRV